MTLSSTLKRSMVVAAGVALVAAGYLISTPQAEALTSLNDVQSGDLIRSESQAAVYYYGEDGYRYVFPNSNTYFTWYENFDGVKFISSSDLSKIQIGGNVTFKPGALMVKIVSSPVVYGISGNGTLREIASESMATELYGSNWNQQIRDIPDSFFTNYSIGDALNNAADFDREKITRDAEDIGEDKNLEAPADISMTSNGYSPIEVTIDEGGNVRFTNNDNTNHTASSEDLSWGTGTIMPGESYIVRFDEDGTFPFFDSYDSGNSGAIYVE